MKQVTEFDKDAAAQACPRFFDRARLANVYPGIQLRLPSVTLPLKALPHAVPLLCLWIIGTDTVVMSFKKFLVAASIRNESNVFKV